MERSEALTRAGRPCSSLPAGIAAVEGAAVPGPGPPSRRDSAWFENRADGIEESNRCAQFLLANLTGVQVLQYRVT